MNAPPSFLSRDWLRGLLRRRAVPRQHPARDEAAVVEDLLRKMLDDASRGDVAAVEAVIARNALLYKVGRLGSDETLIAAVREFKRLGGSAEYTLSDMVTRVDGALAVVTMRTRALIRIPGQAPREARWLESVTLTRTDRWRIVFYHSTDDAEWQGRPA